MKTVQTCDNSTTNKMYLSFEKLLRPNDKIDKPLTE